MVILLPAVVYNTSEKYGEVEVRKGQEKVRLNVRGEVNHVPKFSHLQAMVDTADSPGLVTCLL
jgi:hypothetical protein